jgi:hypothetical protein
MFSEPDSKDGKIIREKYDLVSVSKIREGKLCEELHTVVETSSGSMCDI